MSPLLQPISEAEAADMVRAAAVDQTRLMIIGGNTRSGFGDRVDADAVLCAQGLSGIVTYDPAEMVMTALAGTPMPEVEAALAGNNQMLAFEPVDHRDVMGTRAQSRGEPTIGGVFLSNASGPRRLSAGAARDSLLGIRFINGAGTAIKAGGRVMKNVTGLDLVKLLAGSHGTLGFVTEVTFRVLPRPEAVATLVLAGLDDAQAAAAMALALAQPADISGAAHLPRSVSGLCLDGGRLPDEATVFRLEGLPASVAGRAERLAGTMAAFGPVTHLGKDDSLDLWRRIRDVAPYADDTARPVWRVSVAPSAGHRLVAALRMEAGVDAFYDWQGGLVWMRMEAAPDADLVRRTIASSGGGHATLIRASVGDRATTPAFEPQPAAVAALSARIKQKLDPAGIFSPGKMG